MADTRDLRFNFIGNDQSLGGAFDSVQTKATAFGTMLGSLAGGGLRTLGTALVGAFKDGTEELKGNQAAMAQFQAGVEKTGGAAKVTTDEMVALADSIEAKTGTDGAAVVAGGALLATFTKVRDEVGKGNDVFSRATQAGVDLAARGFGSVESNAVTLGKALQDPIKGVAALGKQGVTFTAAQKETIASMVKTGNVLGAQKIVLSEVEAQVGGSAEAYGKTLPGQMARAAAAFDGIKETVVKAVLPAMTGLLTFVTTTLIPGFQSLSEQLGPALDQLVPMLAGLGQALVTTLMPAFQTIGTVLTTVVVPALTGLFGFIAANQTTLGALAIAIGTITLALSAGAIASAAGTAAMTVYLGVMGAGMGVINAVRTAVLALNTAFMANPIGIVVLALVALVAGLVFAYKHSEQFRDIVNNAFESVKGAAQALGAFFTDTIPAAFQSVKDTVDAVLEAFKTAITSYFEASKLVITTVLDAIKTAVTTAWDAIKTAVETVLQAVKTAITTYVEAWRTVITTAMDLIKTAVTTAWDAITGAVSTALDTVKSTMSSAWSAIQGAVEAAWAALGRAVDTGFDAILGYVKAWPGNVITNLGNLGEKLFNFAKAAWGRFDSAVDAALAAIIKTVSGLGGRIVAGVGNLGGLLYDAGGDLLRGLANGITGAIGDVIDAARKAARAAVDAVTGFLGISSPSKVFAQLGAYSGQGLAKGLLSTQGLVQDSASRLLDTAALAGTVTAQSRRTTGLDGAALGATGSLDDASAADIVAAVERLEQVFRDETNRRLQLTRSGALTGAPLVAL